MTGRQEEEKGICCLSVRRLLPFCLLPGSWLPAPLNVTATAAGLALVEAGSSLQFFNICPSRFTRPPQTLALTGQGPLLERCGLKPPSNLPQLPAQRGAGSMHLCPHHTAVWCWGRWARATVWKWEAALKLILGWFGGKRNGALTGGAISKARPWDGVDSCWKEEG